MKRDMDLVRKIMLLLNNHEHGYAPSDLSIDGYSEEQIGYHCFLLNDAGLIEAEEECASGEQSPFAIPTRLTWEGHEFIENAQNEKIWGQTKEAVHKLGNASFSVWAQVLTKVVMTNLGLNE